MTAQKFLSTENDLRLTAIYVAALVLLIFAGEALAGDRPNPAATQSNPNAPSHPNSPVYEERTLLSQSGHTAEGATSSAQFCINTSAEWLEIKLTWTDDYGNNDRFALAIVFNNNELGREEGTSGALAVGIDAGEGGALGGNFTVDITAIDCPGVVSASPVDRDSGNDWMLEVLGSVKA